MSPQVKNRLPDWVVQAFIIGACSVSTGFVISMRSDITTLMVRTEGMDKTVMTHEKRLDVGEATLKDLAIRVYEVKRCCD